VHASPSIGRAHGVTVAASPWRRLGAASTITQMDLARARTIAERVHAGDRESDGTPRLWHVRRVVTATPVAMQTVAWLHEVLDTGAVSEQELLLAGLEGDELRALRLLRAPWSESDVVRRAHLELIARAAGRSGEIARTVAVADLEDRCARAERTRPQALQSLRRLLSVPVDTADSRAIVAGG
jgi:hypothetical protein